jgi:hypothetical protein
MGLFDFFKKKETKIIKEVVVIDEIKTTKNRNVKLTETEKLFRRACKYNWDNGFTSLKKMILNEHCDKGTALFIYWMSRPEWYRQYTKVNEVPSHEISGYLFIKFVEEQYSKISKEEIIFDPYEANEVGMYEKDIKYKSALPKIMYSKTNGTIHYSEVRRK